MEKKKIIIIGGGTAGASAAVFLQAKLGKACDIEVLTSKDIPIVGVGEATVGNINQFLEACDLEPEKICLDDARGSIKYSVHCKDWYADNHSYFTPIGLFAMEYHDFYTFGRPIKEYWKSWCGLNLGLKGKAPFLKHEYWNTDIPKVWREYAYNIDAGLLGKKLLDVAIERGAIINDVKISEVKIIDTDKIDYLITDDGKKIEGDFFVDCSGFNRLIPNACGYTPKSWKDENPNNREWATRIDYVDRTDELSYLSCVECQTMDAGWRWQIGLRDRIGTGYVFSTDYISEEDALQEFKDSYEGDRVKDDECQLIKFETECYEKQAGTNWITCGLSSGFVEPLESTSIFFMHNNLMAFLSLIKQNRLPKDIQMLGMEAWDVSDEPVHYFFNWDNEKIDLYNTYATDTFECTVNYVGAHYAFNKNNKSKYWNDWAEKREKYVSIGSKAMTYKQQHLFFSRAAYSILAAGNNMGTEIEGWDLSKVFVSKRQESAWESGQLKTEKEILQDRTPKEYLYVLRNYLGRMTHRAWLNDIFSDHAYDYIDQYKWLDHYEELNKEELISSKNYIHNMTTDNLS
jgi:tryptophan halogenase